MQDPAHTEPAVRVVVLVDGLLVGDRHHPLAQVLDLPASLADRLKREGAVAIVDSSAAAATPTTNEAL